MEQKAEGRHKVSSAYDKIPIRNVYYMLSYVLPMLQQQKYKKVGMEDFHNVADLCAEILILGVADQLKRGLGREYIPREEALSSLRGKIELAESLKAQTMRRRQLICSYDDFSVNSYMNRIIKSTMLLLLGARVDKKRKKMLRKQLVFFGDVDLLDVHTINWAMHYDRNNQSYRLLISVCYLAVKNLLQTDKSGNAKLMDFFDRDKLPHLYEKFILNYYKIHFRELNVNASEIKWAIDEKVDLLPAMLSDVLLKKGNKVLIIDAKCYKSSTQERHDKKTFHSGNLYQIFTYVKNRHYKYGDEEVSGMLLYARTDEEIQPDATFSVHGSRLSVRTLDLNQPFEQIAAQLDNIVEEYFGKLVKTG